MELQWQHYGLLNCTKVECINPPDGISAIVEKHIDGDWVWEVGIRGHGAICGGRVSNGKELLTAADAIKDATAAIERNLHKVDDDIKGDDQPCADMEILKIGCCPAPDETINFIEDLSQALTMTAELSPQQRAILSLIEKALPITRATSNHQVSDHFDQAIQAMTAFLDSIYAMVE